jgi:hypothetical protein
VGAQAISKEGERLGLTWGLRPAEVIDSTGGSSQVKILYDGDTEAIGAVNLIGELLGEGARVLAVRVPPSGNFVVGHAPTGYVLGRITYDTLVGASAQLILGAGDVLVPGTQITVTVVNSARYNATGIFDFEETALGTTICLGKLYVDGANHASNRQAILAVAAVGDRASVAQQWDGILSAGSHTLELRATRNAAAGTQRANLLHTSLRVQAFE